MKGKVGELEKEIREGFSSKLRKDLIGELERVLIFNVRI